MQGTHTIGSARGRKTRDLMLGVLKNEVGRARRRNLEEVVSKLLNETHANEANLKDIGWKEKQCSFHCKIRAKRV